jgi:hypothetical protein
VLARRQCGNRSVPPSPQTRWRGFASVSGGDPRHRRRVAEEV